MAEADDLGSPGADDWYGSGLVNLYRALRTIKEKDLALASLYFDPPELIQGESTEMVAVFQNRGTERIADGAAVIKIDDKVELADPGKKIARLQEQAEKLESQESKVKSQKPRAKSQEPKNNR